VVVVNQVELKPRQSMEQVLGLAPDQAVPRILVADDNETNRRLMMTLLGTLGFEVQAASNGQEAVTLGQSWAPQLILMDLRMPILDGYRATQQLRSVATDPSPVIIALSASAFDEEEAVALESGCDGFLRKPIREADLLEVIQRHLGVRYLYAASPPQADSDALDPAPSDVLTSAFVDLPVDWVDRLYEGALVANSQALYALLEEFPPDHDSLALMLRRWVQNFRFDKIIELVEQGRDTTPREPDHSDCG
jgi:CheY-like chemotaxis protein